MFETFDACIQPLMMSRHAGYTCFDSWALAHRFLYPPQKGRVANRMHASDEGQISAFLDLARSSFQ